MKKVIFHGVIGIIFLFIFVVNRNSSRNEKLERKEMKKIIGTYREILQNHICKVDPKCGCSPHDCSEGTFCKRARDCGVDGWGAACIEWMKSCQPQCGVECERGSPWSPVGCNWKRKCKCEEVVGLMDLTTKICQQQVETETHRVIPCFK